MHSNLAPSLSPRTLAASMAANSHLIRQLAWREIVGRYRGSLAGLAWSFFNPLLMLLVYTFVFSVVFKSRWGTTGESRADFAMILFVGLIVHGMFAECVNRAASLVLANASYVKKVVFPLEVMPWVSVLSALFHTAVSVLVLLMVQLVVRHTLPWTALFFPLLLLPLALTTAGVSYLLAATGVYLRDIGQIAVMFTTVLFFVSPVVYPMSGVPEELRPWMLASPLTQVIEQGRGVLIYGSLPDWGGWLMAMAIGAVIACAGFACFQAMRRGFADVL